MSEEVIKRVVQVLSKPHSFYGRAPWLPKEPDGKDYTAEEIAKLKKDWEKEHGSWELWLKARNVIEALREPTEQMLNSGWEKGCIDYCSVSQIRQEWQAMIDIALSE